jgi:hypothetical protein
MSTRLIEVSEAKTARQQAAEGLKVRKKAEGTSAFAFAKICKMRLRIGSAQNSGCGKFRILF